VDMTPEERFAALADEFAGQPGVRIPDSSARRAFGSSALKVDGSIFAMLSGGSLVVKLPRGRVAALIEEGTGGPYDAGKGRPMAEWLTVMTADDHSWLALAREAMEFVASRKG
jgi:TfoX/Sxy family transcriptional regulator of competence genes